MYGAGAGSDGCDRGSCSAPSGLIWQYGASLVAIITCPAIALPFCATHSSVQLKRLCNVVGSHPVVDRIEPPNRASAGRARGQVQAPVTELGLIFVSQSCPARTRALLTPLNSLSVVVCCFVAPLCYLQAKRSQLLTSHLLPSCLQLSASDGTKCGDLLCDCDAETSDSEYAEKECSDAGMCKISKGYVFCQPA